MRSSIQFVLNGEIRDVSAVEPSLTVMRYLRELEHLVGTKEGCAEGDCGACTAVVATLEGDALQYRAINTCIQFLGALDGKALITVEYLKDAYGLHPVQDAMIVAQASQCGFCTPGFVMSLFAGHQNRIVSDRKSIDNLLAGNLCRCTGYTSIIDAAAMALSQTQDRDYFSVREQSIVKQLKKVNAKGSAQISKGDARYIAPATLRELSQILKRIPKAVLVAGGTDVGLTVTKKQRRLETFVDIGKIRELRLISSSKRGLTIGAGVTYADARKALASIYPPIAALIDRLGSVQIRSVGTIGGNIASGSPIGDMPPALIAADAKLSLRVGSNSREIPLEHYFVSYGVQDRRRSEFIEAVFIPYKPSDSSFKVYKVSKRFDQDISTVCGAFNLRIDRKTAEIKPARICFGGMAGVPARATNCESFLVGRKFTEDATARAVDIIKSEFDPISDWRGSAAYRREVAGNLFRRYFRETSLNTKLQLTEAESLCHA